MNKLITTFAFVWFCTLPAEAQTTPQPDSVPIYHVTVVSRTLAAVNYQHRSGPTKIDFQGTVLLPTAHGEATIESKKGRMDINCKFVRLEAPQRFGPGFLTYVLWAITPEGRAINLGEVLPGANDKADLHVTTDLQAFGLMVTAEPYFAVSQPSDVVTLENKIRSETNGKIEEVNAKYELMPRAQYTYDVPSSEAGPASNAPKVSMSQYEALTQLYQAQNAVQIARSLGADRYASETYNKAVQLLNQAQASQQRKENMRTVVTLAREASQTAEDARVITIKRLEEQRLATEQRVTERAQSQ